MGHRKRGLTAPSGGWPPCQAWDWALKMHTLVSIMGEETETRITWQMVAMLRLDPNLVSLSLPLLYPATSDQQIRPGEERNYCSTVPGFLIFKSFF